MNCEECCIFKFLRSDLKVTFPLGMDSMIKGRGVSQCCLISSTFTREFWKGVEKPAFTSCVK